MNQDIIGGQWKQLKGKVKQQWGELTDDDLDRISGKQEEVVGLIQERYGWEHEKAQAAYDDFVKSQSMTETEKTW